MIHVKNPSQLEKMRAAGKLLHQVLKSVRAYIEPGMTTDRVDAYAEKLIRDGGAIPSSLGYNGYPKSICASIDDMVVHGIPDGTVLREGMILSVDATLLLDGWQADSAFTVGVGRISPEAQKLIDVTEQSFFEGARQAVEGNRISDIGHAVQTYIEGFGYGAVRALCGHGIGREMHEDPEVPNYGNPGHGARLRRGMTITVEPMITGGSWEVEMLEDGWTVVTADGSPCAHYEHTIAITDGLPELLTLPGFDWEGQQT